MLKEKLKSMYEEADVAYEKMLSEKVNPIVEQEAMEIAKILCENMVEKMTTEINSNNGKPPMKLELYVEMRNELGNLTVYLETVNEERAAVFPSTPGTNFENKMCQQYNSKLSPVFQRYLMEKVNEIMGREGIFSVNVENSTMFCWSR